QVLRLSVHDRLEPFFNELLEHRASSLITAQIGFGLAFDIVTFRVNPSGGADDLKVLYVIGDLYQLPQGRIRCAISADTTGKTRRLTSAVIALDRRHFESTLNYNRRFVKNGNRSDSKQQVFR